MRRSEAGSMLGIARRAGAVVVGTEAARQAVRDGRAELVLIAEDASAGQQKKLLPLLENSGVPHHVWGTRAELGGAIGAGLSSAVAITQAPLAAEIERRMADDAAAVGNEGSEGS